MNQLSYGFRPQNQRCCASENSLASSIPILVLDMSCSFPGVNLEIEGALHPNGARW